MWNNKNSYNNVITEEEIHPPKHRHMTIKESNNTLSDANNSAHNSTENTKRWYDPVWLSVSLALDDSPRFLLDIYPQGAPKTYIQLPVFFSFLMGIYFKHYPSSEPSPPLQPKTLPYPTRPQIWTGVEIEKLRSISNLIFPLTANRGTLNAEKQQSPSMWLWDSYLDLLPARSSQARDQQPAVSQLRVQRLMWFTASFFLHRFFPLTPRIKHGRDWSLFTRAVDVVAAWARFVLLIMMGIMIDENDSFPPVLQSIQGNCMIHPSQQHGRLFRRLHWFGRVARRCLPSWPGYRDTVTGERCQEVRW